jgi:hypothetical protein
VPPTAGFDQLDPLPVHYLVLLLAVLQVIQGVDVIIQVVDVAPLGGHLRA